MRFLSIARSIVFKVLILSMMAVPLMPCPGPAQENEYSLEEAYKKEFAFLEMQKRDMQERLQAFRAEANRERGKLERSIDRLTDRVIELDNEILEVKDEIDASERAIATKLDNESLLEGTIEQGLKSLEEYGDRPDIETLRDLQAEEKTSLLFREADELLYRLNSLRQEAGNFYLTDGSLADGTIIRVGNIAAYGVSEQESGVLAPAGAGEFKLWPESNGDDARALVGGKLPGQLDVFLFESLNEEVSIEGRQSVIEYINDGGIIGWVIFVLGLLGAVLLLVRFILLRLAASGTGYIFENVAEMVKHGKFDEALQACRARKGSASRVVEATLNNLGRDKEELENIITENIIQESSVVERFGPFILIIAGVAPLLGLLGTVTGMISTFDVITEFGTGDPKMLSGGIATALVTTQLGLAVAIPTLLCGSLLTAWGNRIKDDMERVALHIITRSELGEGQG